MNRGRAYIFQGSGCLVSRASPLTHALELFQDACPAPRSPEQLPDGAGGLRVRVSFGKELVLNDRLVVRGHSCFCESGLIKGNMFLFQRKAVRNRGFSGFICCN